MIFFNVIFLFLCRFCVNLINNFGKRLDDSSVDEQNNKSSVINEKYTRKTSKVMEKFEFEMLQTELLAEAIESASNGTQLHHRRNSWNKVSFFTIAKSSKI